MITLRKQIKFTDQPRTKDVENLIKQNKNNILPLLKDYIFKINNHLISNIENIYDIENQCIFYMDSNRNNFVYDKNYYTSLKSIVRHLENYPEDLNLDTWNDSQIDSLIRVLTLTSKEFEDKYTLIKTLYLYK
jgi:hypothetical protein